MHFSALHLFTKRRLNRRTEPKTIEIGIKLWHEIWRLNFINIRSDSINISRIYFKTIFTSNSKEERIAHTKCAEKLLSLNCLAIDETYKLIEIKSVFALHCSPVPPGPDRLEIKADESNWMFTIFPWLTFKHFSCHFPFVFPLISFLAKGMHSNIPLVSAERTTNWSSMQRIDENRQVK